MTSLWNSAHVLLFLHTCRAVHCLLWCTGPAFSSSNAGISTSRKANAADLAPRATDSSVFLPVIWKRPKRGAHSTLFIDSLNEKSRVYHVPGQQILPYCCCCSFSKSCPSLCGPMNCSTPGSSVLYCLPEFALIHVHTELVMLSDHLILCRPPLLEILERLKVCCLAAIAHLPNASDTFAALPCVRIKTRLCRRPE